MNAALISTSPLSAEHLRTQGEALGFDVLEAQSGCRVINITEADAWSLLAAIGQESTPAAMQTLLVAATSRADLIDKAFRLREEVFLREIGRDRQTDTDEFDATAQHIVAVLNLGNVVGTLRCYLLDSNSPSPLQGEGRGGVALESTFPPLAGGLRGVSDSIVEGIKIGRVAVQRDLRGNGIGQELMLLAHSWASAQNYRYCYLHAEESAIGFYQKLNYESEGDWFPEAGKRHMRMRFLLS